jgi:hypothetical protein
MCGMCTKHAVPVMGKDRIGVPLSMLMDGLAMNIEHAIERSSAFVVIVVSSKLDRFSRSTLTLLSWAS